jgi:hypothetical protein
MKGTDEESEEREHRSTGEPDVEGHQLERDAPGQTSRENPQEQQNRE